MRSEFAMSAPEGFDSSPVTAEWVMENRVSNLAHFDNSRLPRAERALVIGAGPSVTGEVLGEIPWYTWYDAILITYPMAEMFKTSIMRHAEIFVVDGEFHDTTTHFYGDFKECVWLICPWEKKLEKDWKFRATTFMMPEGEPNWEKRARMSPNYPKSTGAIALQVALEDMGGETKVDVIGIDCTGDCQQYREETLRIIEKHRDRVNLISCGIGD